MLKGVIEESGLINSTPVNALYLALSRSYGKQIYQIVTVI